jgi:ribosomal protein S18 acetylase RimI-like enzyme
MVNTVREGLFVKHSVTAQELAEMQQLADLGSVQEHLLVQFDYNMLTQSTLPTDDIFLCYQRDQLVGILLLDRYHSDVKEVEALVHPDWRRQGIGRQLLEAAKKECTSRGIGRLLLVCETISASGHAFLQSVGATREFAEHRMVLRNFQPRFQYDDHLLVRDALHDDLEELALIIATDFEDSKEKARQHLLRVFERPNQNVIIATYGGEDVGCAEPVGTLRVEDMPHELGIYGFFVRPEYRGRGHGRQIIEEAIATWQAKSQKPFMLEVDTNNLNALNLYRSLGFVIEHTYEYYGLALN